MGIGYSLEDLRLLGQNLNRTTIGDAGQFLIGNRPGALQNSMANDIFGLTKMVPGVGARTAAKVGRIGARLAPAMSVAGNVMDVADIIAGDESFGNKAMDATGMVIGGTAGAFLGGPLGASLGASVGKMGSDGLQWLFGDKKTPDQRKLEAALAMLNGGIV